MRVLRYITHPQVNVDLARPPHTWRLSEFGRVRAAAIPTQPWAASIGRIISSREDKAIETARLWGAQTDIEPELRDGLGENDRSATGPLPPAEFERVANEFFARPDEQVRGWESARDAQRRIVAGLRDLLDPSAPTDIAVVGHGAVGTLWYCHLAGLEIDRRHDQPGQGHYFTVELSSSRPLHGWRSIG